MSLTSSFNEVLDRLLRGVPNSLITTEQLISCLDLTLLEEHVSREALVQLKNKASANQVAAVCVYRKDLYEFQQINPVQVATVINFPHGNEPINTVLDSIDKAAQSGATEIDYVFPYVLYLEGQKQITLKQCNQVIESCKKHHLTLKIILETGAFSDMQTIYELSKKLIGLGCNFLKTSTGKIAQGASLSAVFAMLSAIKESNHCGLKISGGIKTPLQAFNYANLAELMMNKKIHKTWFRIGASTLLEELLKKKSLD